MEPSCLSPQSPTSLLNHDAIKFLLLTTVQETESEATEARNSGDRESLNSTARCSALGATVPDPRGMPTTPSSTRMLARINGWKEEEKATYLPVSLKVPALTVWTVLNDLPPESLYSYDALVSALETCFGSAHQAELHRVRFKARLRKRDEDLPELAEDIE